MKTLATTLVVSSLFFGLPAIAGGGHDHGHSHAKAAVTQSVAETNADKIIASLITREKIDNIWSGTKASSVDKKEINGSTEWVAIYINEKITDQEKQKLYVFLTVSGEYIAVNYTGK